MANRLLDNNSAAQPPGTNINVDNDTILYRYLGVPSDDIGFPFSSAYCQHLRQPPHKSHVNIYGKKFVPKTMFRIWNSLR
jgi:hypothetical protein